MSKQQNNSNKSRFVYTLSTFNNRNTKNIGNNSIVIELFEKGSNLFFSREPQSSEKFIYSEQEMYSIVRTLLFVILFETIPCENDLEIFRFNEFQNVTFDFNKPVIIKPSSSADDETIDFFYFSKIVDEIFGENFSILVHKILIKLYFVEWNDNWRFFFISNQQPIELPSAWDYVNLIKFLNLKDNFMINQFSNVTKVLNLKSKKPLTTNKRQSLDNPLSIFY